MQEPQPHDCQNRIIVPSDYVTLGLSLHYRWNMRTFSRKTEIRYITSNRPSPG